MNSISLNQAKKTKFLNLSIAGFYVIDAARADLESACPGDVPSAKIKSLITRDVTPSRGQGE